MRHQRHSRRQSQTNIESIEPLVLFSVYCIQAPAGGIVLDDWFNGSVLNGGEGDDILVAYAGDSELIGNGGDDVLWSQRGSNLLDGGEGTDTVRYFDVQDAFDIQRGASGQIIVSTADRTDTLFGIEFLEFSDGTVSVDEVVPASQEFRTFDGTNNNLASPDLGSTGEELIRLADSEFGDGISSLAGQDRPSAREVSNVVSDMDISFGNAKGLTDAVWAWGQFLDHDITITPEDHATPESEPIQVPTGDPFFDPDSSGDDAIPFTRSGSSADSGTSVDNPREQTNEITAFVDASMVYGSDDARAAELREFSGGRMRVSAGNLLPVDQTTLGNADNGSDPSPFLFLGGDVRANENVALTSLHTLFVREHNLIADQLAQEDPSLTDEELFQRARQWVTAEIQAISFNEFLPSILGDTAFADYSGYDRSVNPNIATEFSTAAYRFGHSMLSETLLRLNPDGSPAVEGPIELRDAFFQPEQLVDHGIDSTLKGLTEQLANEVDPKVIDGVRNFLFGAPGSGGFDLASLNIQRGRDHGLADYNDTRVALGLSAVTSFADITSDTEMQQRLQQAYGSVDKIDLWVGGLAEDHVGSGSLGETFRAIIVDQFTRLRDGDRFWYERIFSGEDLETLRNTTLADVISRNTTNSGLRNNVFIKA